MVPTLVHRNQCVDCTYWDHYDSENHHDPTTASSLHRELVVEVRGGRVLYSREDNDELQRGK